MARRKTALLCDLGKTDVAQEIGPQDFLGAALLPGRQATAQLGRCSCCRAVRNEMSAQCLVNLIEKQPRWEFLLVEEWQQSAAEMLYHGIGSAERTCDCIDFGQPFTIAVLAQRRHWDVEVEG